MATGSGEYVMISADHYLRPLGLPDLRGALPKRRHELFEAIVEYLRQDGLVIELPAGMPAGSAQEADLRIPGTPVHVHVSAIKQPQLNEIITLLGGLGLHERGGEYVITLAGLQALARLFSVLKTKYGERSIVEALRAAKPATAEAVTGILHGAPCRHPRASCRYMEDGTCMIPEPAVATSLADLSSRGIVLRLNAVEPYEYSLSI
jgi:hypothetical protein